MGSNTEIACQNCDYKEEFIIGIGMMYFQPNLTSIEGESALLPDIIKSKKIQLHIRKLVEDKNATIPNTYGHDIYHCKSCNSFYNRFFIHLDFDGGSFEPEYSCPKCKKKLELVDYTIISEEEFSPEKEWSFSKHSCPKCGEKTYTSL